MSEIVEIIDNLELKIQKLLSKMEQVEQQSSRLKLELDKAQSIAEKQSQEMSALKQKCESLKMANSLLGSEENKRDTKLKINSLIREIDYCIAQLAD